MEIPAAADRGNGIFLPERPEKFYRKRTRKNRERRARFVPGMTSNAERVHHFRSGRSRRMGFRMVLEVRRGRPMPTAGGAFFLILRIKKERPRLVELEEARQSPNNNNEPGRKYGPSRCTVVR